MELREVKFVHQMPNNYNFFISINDIDTYFKKLRYADIKFEYFKRSVEGNGFTCEFPIEYRQITMLMRDEDLLDIDINFLRMYRIRMYVDNLLFVHRSILNNSAISYLEEINPTAPLKVLFRRIIDISMRTDKMIGAIKYILTHINTETKELENMMNSKIAFDTITDEDLHIFVDVAVTLLKRHRRKIGEDKNG